MYLPTNSVLFKKRVEISRLSSFFHCFTFEELLFQIVHDCASHLYTCYTHEEINETKVGQLELTKQVNHHS